MHGADAVDLSTICGQTDYLVKVGTPIFGILLAAADRTLHKLLTMRNALTN